MESSQSVAVALFGTMDTVAGEHGQAVGTRCAEHGRRSSVRSVLADLKGRDRRERARKEGEDRNSRREARGVDDVNGNDVGGMAERSRPGCCSDESRVVFGRWYRCVVGVLDNGELKGRRDAMRPTHEMRRDRYWSPRHCKYRHTCPCKTTA